ncbi:unnamed protein product [Mycena citricolor]|uniref:F-box domain-containing protein n=1 Tax=Mycena citricolor TaxID=2018698 RepID=A0AAD2JY08_9AGAR|nr:unnamed protein product [Mycena citricolor]
MSVFTLPNELLLHICSQFLPPPDILTLRQTCRKFANVSRDRSLWLHFLRGLRRRGDVPLPEAADRSAAFSGDLERIVIAASRTADTWQLPRAPIHFFTPYRGETILGLEIFEDLWILILYTNGLVYLHRTNSPESPPVAEISLPADTRWRSYCARMLNNTVFFAISDWSDSCETRLYAIDTRSPGLERGFELIHKFFTAERTVCALDPTKELLFMNTADEVLDIIQWGKNPSSVTQFSVENEADEFYNGVLALRCVANGFLLVRMHTIELRRTKSSSFEQDGDAITHRLPHSLREKNISMSEIQLDGKTSTARIHLLVHDSHDLNYYTITVSAADDGALSLNVAHARTTQPAQTQVPHYQRPFISTHALGSQGIRAVWIERESLRMSRCVRLCAIANTRAREDMQMESAATVFESSSYDLRDDWTHCAIGEMSGVAVLGNRAGQVFVLPIGYGRVRQVKSKLDRHSSTIEIIKH